MLALLVAALAVFWAWETLLVLSPWTIPSWLQPFVVLVAALVFCWPDWRVAGAAAGAVGLLHVAVRGVIEPPVPAQAVRVRPGVGSRVPDLP